MSCKKSWDRPPDWSDFGFSVAEFSHVDFFKIHQGEISLRKWDSTTEGWWGDERDELG